MKSKKTVIMTVIGLTLCAYLGTVIYSFGTLSTSLKDIDSIYKPLEVLESDQVMDDNDSDSYVSSPTMTLKLEDTPLASGQICLPTQENTYVVVDVGEEPVSLEYASNESVLRIEDHITVVLSTDIDMPNGISRLTTEDGFATVLSYSFKKGIRVSAVATSKSEEGSIKDYEILKHIYENLALTDTQSEVVFEDMHLHSDVVVSESGVEFSQGEDVIYIGRLKSSLDGTNMSKSYELPNGKSVVYNPDIKDIESGYTPFILEGTSSYKILAKDTDQLERMFSVSQGVS